jgi:GMP synthase (glutamine-hydrolysing)
MSGHQTIIIIDFGSQYTQLITRRIRESNVYSEVYPHDVDIACFKSKNVKGIILSGGPLSVYNDNAPKFNPAILDMKVPVLGICYGLQLLCLHYGGKVKQAENREYGKAKIQILHSTGLFKDVENNSIVWMSHGDYLTKLPEGFKVLGTSDHSPICAIYHEFEHIYGVQFHPEVVHTEYGRKIINNFLFSICRCTGEWTPMNFIDEKINSISEIVGSNKAICALSGGVDSTVAAVLVNKAVGDKLISIHIDNGLMRKNESEMVFLSALKDVTDPEEKRKIIGNTFITVFEEEASKIENAKFLVQGTLYPDVIESVSEKGASATIKTHHNVGGLPEKMHLKLIEPFRELFKDEVRRVGEELGIDEELVQRHPFPGPGLAVRVLGEITKPRLDILREADDIFISAIREAGLYNKIWQAFAILLPVSTVGVMGDSRTYEYVLSLRAVTSHDGMTADWFSFEHDFLADVSKNIINKVRGINRVVYDISSKPPATIEWE